MDVFDVPTWSAESPAGVTGFSTRVAKTHKANVGTASVGKEAPKAREVKDGPASHKTNNKKVKGKTAMVPQGIKVKAPTEPARQMPRQPWEGQSGAGMVKEALRATKGRGKKPTGTKSRTLRAVKAPAPASAKVVGDKDGSSSEAAPKRKKSRNKFKPDGAAVASASTGAPAKKAVDSAPTSHTKKDTPKAKALHKMPESGASKEGARGKPAGTGKGSQRTMVEKMRAKLKGGQFRMINEDLYTTTGSAALAMFRKEPQLFEVYHEGFREQVTKWPTNPVDVMIEFVKTLPKNFVVADMGCGEAALAAAVPHKVHSFDLVAHNAKVTAGDMANVPLKDASVDVVIFSLSLMGVNFIDYLVEARRIVRPDGIVRIAEVASRIKDAKRFEQTLSLLGFNMEHKDNSNKVFVDYIFERSRRPIDVEDVTRRYKDVLAPCMYKKR